MWSYNGVTDLPQENDPLWPQYYLFCANKRDVYFLYILKSIFLLHLTDFGNVCKNLTEFLPDCIVHYQTVTSA